MHNGARDLNLSARVHSERVALKPIQRKKMQREEKRREDKIYIQEKRIMAQRVRHCNVRCVGSGGVRRWVRRRRKRPA